eukprot:1200260-Rhodomonas_salina.1
MSGTDARCTPLPLVLTHAVSPSIPYWRCTSLPLVLTCAVCPTSRSTSTDSRCMRLHPAVLTLAMPLPGARHRDDPHPVRTQVPLPPLRPQVRLYGIILAQYSLARSPSVVPVIA